MEERESVYGRNRRCLHEHMATVWLNLARGDLDDVRGEGALQNKAAT